MNLEYPMLFNVSNRSWGRVTHCGVLEFIAEEGVMYMPYWVPFPTLPTPHLARTHARTHTHSG